MPDALLAQIAYRVEVLNGTAGCTREGVERGFFGHEDCHQRQCLQREVLVRKM